MRCIQGTYAAYLKHRAYSIHIGVNMKRTRSPDNRPLLGQIIKIEEVPPLISIPNEVNSPRILQREPTQVSGFGNGIAGHSQPALNPSVNQLLFTNRRVNSPTRVQQAPLLNSIPNAINPPLMTQREPAQVSELCVGIVRQSQPAPNPIVDQLVSTNVRLSSLPISPTKNIINQPRLTDQMLPAAIEAISNDDLETAMQIVGVKSIEELVYLTEGRGNTLLAYAAQLGRAKPIKILLSKVLDPQQLIQKKNNNGYTALIIAASLGYAKAITAMLKGVDNPQQLAEQIDTKGATALHYAAVYGHAGAIMAMLKGVGNPQQLAEQIDTKSATALLHAVKNGHEAATTAILSNVPNPQQLAEQQTTFGSLALSAAASRGHVGVITSIFSRVSNPQQLAEQQSINGSTALMYAVNSSASTLIITKIFESVVDTEKLIFQVHNEGLNSFTHALKKGNMEAALLLFDLAKNKTALLLRKNSPNQPAAIQIMTPDILEIFLNKYNENKE
ncbi:MAG: hypothetical protein RIR02_468 [Pseudomonadota bacterium]